MVQEIVIFQIKADQLGNLSQLLTESNAFLKNQQGLLSRKTLQDEKDATMLVDIVEWESLEDALQAADKFPKLPALQSFFKAIEKVHSFGHYHEIV